MEQARILGRHAENTQCYTGTMPALSSTNTGIIFLWHFPVNEVDCISVLMYDNALCRLLIFPLQASETLIWME